MTISNAIYDRQKREERELLTQDLTCEDSTPIVMAPIVMTLITKETRA